MKTDIEIAQSTKLEPIAAVAAKIGIKKEDLIPYGHCMAKIPYQMIDEHKVKQNKLILVTAITPTKAGIGKTTVSIGLALGLNKIGKQATVVLREPSLGPCFGMKGGAAGGGYAQVLPMEDINLHFTGDFHAITCANNMISALLDNYIHQNKNQTDGVKQVLWRRAADINDRSLRHIITGVGGAVNGVLSESGFDITPASEIMAILCLAKDRQDLTRRIEKIVLAYTYSGKPIMVKDLGIAGAIVVLLKDAIHPNLVQTTEGSPAIMHGGPFANIAHGCNSIIATKMGLSHSDYVVTESGFGADLGAEKFFNIKCRQSGLVPDLTLVAVTTQALKMHGGVPLKEIKTPNAAGLTQGLANMDQHIRNLQAFGQTVAVVFNRYSFDVIEEIELVQQHCNANGIEFVVNDAFAQGGAGAVDLAQKVVTLVEQQAKPALQFTYADTDSIIEKIEKIALNTYGAAKVVFSAKALAALTRIEALDAASYPVCIAKTQYSFSDDDKAYGVPRGFTLHINDLVLNNGAEFIVAIARNIMRMPGLPKKPMANNICFVNDKIVGLS